MKEVRYQRLFALTVPSLVLLLAFSFPLWAPRGASGDGAGMMPSPAQISEIVAEIDAGDPRAALTAAVALVGRIDPRGVACHDLYHAIGERTGAQSSDAHALLERAIPLIDLSDAQCEAGYLHGVLVHLIEREGTEGAAAREICLWLRTAADENVTEPCLHGLGHGVGALVTAGRLTFVEGSLACADIERLVLVGSGPLAGSCMSGLAMEYFDAVNPARLDGSEGGRCLLVADEPSRSSCIDIFEGSRRATRIDREELASLTATALCTGATGRFGWACRGVAGEVAANVGDPNDPEMLSDQLGHHCDGDLRCLVVGVAGASLLRGPIWGSEFCATLPDSVDCAAVLGASLIDPTECKLLAEGRERCLSAQRLGMKTLELIAPPPDDPGQPAP